MRLVFLGTPVFAVPTLERVVEAGHQVVAVVTQPDRPSGRGQHASAPPVKEAALRLGLPVYQPERVRRPEALEYLRALAVDAMVVVGYGQIIPQSVIDLAPMGILNVHASLLPKYRGAGPIQWAILNGETRTGVTTMRIDAGLDTGDMLVKAETEISPDEDAISLGQRLSIMGADLLVETLTGLAAGSVVPEKQDPAQATYAPLLKKEDGLIDWGQPAARIHNRVRGLQPWPGAYTSWRGQTLHIWKTGAGGPKKGAGGQGPGAGASAGVVRGVESPRPEYVGGSDSAGGPGPWPLAPGPLFPGPRPPAPGPCLPGRFVSLRPLLVACGEGALELVEVQLEGRKRISATDFANGQRVAENESLGEPHI